MRVDPSYATVGSHIYEGFLLYASDPIGAQGGEMKHLHPVHWSAVTQCHHA